MGAHLSREISILRWSLQQVERHLELHGLQVIGIACQQKGYIRDGWLVSAVSSISSCVGDEWVAGFARIEIGICVVDSERRAGVLVAETPGQGSRTLTLRANTVPEPTFARCRYTHPATP